MTDFGLTQEQVDKLLLSERLRPYIAEYLRPRDLDLFNENPRPLLKDLNEMRKKNAAIHAFAQGAETIEKIGDPKSLEYEIQIAECEGIYGVWSDGTDWIIPFNSHQDAKNFVEQNLEN